MFKINAVCRHWCRLGNVVASRTTNVNDQCRIKTCQQLTEFSSDLQRRWPRGLHLLKVRAHVDVHGNTKAEKCATHSHRNATVPTRCWGHRRGVPALIKMEERIDATGLGELLVIIDLKARF